MVLIMFWLKGATIRQLEKSNELVKVELKGLIKQMKPNIAIIILEFSF